MNTSRRAVSAAAATLVAAFAAPAAWAQTTISIPRKFTFPANFAIVNFTLPGTTTTVQETNYIGAQNATLITPTSVIGPFDAYCVQLEQNIPAGRTYPVTLASTTFFNQGRLGAQSGGAVAWLYNNIAPLVTSDNLGSAGLQLAIWEAEYDWDGTAFTGGTNSSISLAGGNFSLDFASVGQGDAAAGAQIVLNANNYLAQWAGKTSVATWIQSPDNQDLIGPSPLPPGRAIPEPGTLALLSTGALGALGMLRARRRFR